MLRSRNNLFSAIKGIGIILMVMGHCGIPDYWGKIIYEFHMPLFFFCSGYFFKNVESKSSLFYFFKRRIKGIYLKYICWSLVFLALHNVFFQLNIYNDIIPYHGECSYIYQSSDFLYKAIKIVFSMNEHEQLLRSFWFMKQLFLASLFVSTCIYLSNKLTHYNHIHLVVLICLLIMTVISKGLKWTLPAVWDISLVFMSSTFYLSGYIFNRYNLLTKIGNIWISILCIVVLLTGGFVLPWTNMLEYNLITVIPFVTTATSGTILTINISHRIEAYKIKYLFYYLGQNTMVIFSLHMLCFKIGNLIKIELYNMPLYRLAEFQIIYEHNTLFWIIYSIIGISIPLILDYLMKSSKYTRRIWKFFV